MNKTLLFLLLSILAVSGCVAIGPTTKATGAYGVTITDFYSSSAEVEGKNKTVRISMEIENKGGNNISSALGCLLGSDLGGETKNMMWSNESNICQPLTKKLSAADTEKNLAGGAAKFSWTLKSPWLPHPMTRKDMFTGRIYYPYKSRTIANVWIYSEAELEAARQRKESVPTSLYTTKTVGPVDISLNTPQPITYYSAGDTLTLKITLSNIGGGVVFDPAGFSWSALSSPSLTDKTNKIAINYNHPSDLEPVACDNSAELKKGDTVTVSCDFKMNKAITTKQGYPITVSADYGYYVDSSLSITVKGKRGEASE